jgi:hypothetical protein
MVFGEVIGVIVNASAPVDEKFAIFDAIADPVETHIDGFGSALFDGIICNSRCASIIGLNWCGSLRMAHIFEGCAEHCAVFAVVKECAKFGFSSGSKNGFEDGAVDKDGTIEWRRWRIRRRNCGGIC